MSHYAQWLAKAKIGSIKHVTWVCGDQPVLVEEAVDAVRNALGVSDLNYVVMTAGKRTSDSEIWDAAFQYPMSDGANRLVLVRDAEKIANWKPLEIWVANARNLPTVYLLLVSSMSDVYRLNDNGRAMKDRNGKKVLQEPISIIRTKGSVLRCVLSNEQDTIAWIQTRIDADDTLARFILKHASGNLRVVSDVCVKAGVFDGRLNENAVRALCAEAPSDDFVNTLLHLDKPGALLTAPGLPLDEYGTVLTVLSSRLDTLSVLQRAVVLGKTWREASQAQGVSFYLAQQLMPVAKHYDAQRVVQCRQALAIGSDAVSRGIRVGVMETVIALW